MIYDINLPVDKLFYESLVVLYNNYKSFKAS